MATVMYFVMFVYARFFIVSGLAFRSLKEEASDTISGEVSVVIPAHNEERNIATAIHSICKVSSEIVPQIIVVDDGSNDRTGDRVQLLASINPRIELIHLPQNSGKAYALNVGIRKCIAERILTLDADSGTSEHAIRRAMTEMQCRNLDAFAFLLVPKSKRGSLAEIQSVEYVGAMNVERAAQTRLGIVSVLPGAATLYDKKVFRKVKFASDTIAEDADLTLTLARRGARFGFSWYASADSATPVGLLALLRQRRRWAAGHLQCISKHLIWRDCKSLTWLATFANFAFLSAVIPLLSYLVFGMLLVAVVAGDPAYLSILALLGISVWLQRIVFIISLARFRRVSFASILLEPAVMGMIGQIAFAWAIVSLAASKRGRQLKW